MTPERRKQLDEWNAANRRHIANLTYTYIKKLAVTTGIYDSLADPYDAMGNGDGYSSVMVDVERFAELIIKECADYVQSYNINLDICEDIAHDMKQHFGVKH